MGKWVKAADVPKSWEGKQAWQYREWEPSDPILIRVPQNYSRAAPHCEGVWFMLQNSPAPPVDRR